ncbi:MAG: cell division protein FtsQ/DivIB [Micromonosporaceae bacterium]
MTDDGARADAPEPSGSASGARDWKLVRASREAVPSSVRTRTVPSRVARRRRTLRWLAALATVAVVAAAVWVVFGTGVFAVAKVEVTGTKVLTPDQVRGAAVVVIGTPLARLDTEGITARVSRLAPVARVAVERHWPDTVVIRVTERTPVAAVPYARRYSVIDATGVVFQRVPRRPRELPLVELARPGPKDPATRDALRVLAALTPQLRVVLVKLAAPATTRITLHLTKGRTVIWGDAEHSTRKAQAASALLKRAAKVIDVSAPDVVTTR